VTSDPHHNTPLCQCGEMALCPHCDRCMECEAGFDLCESPLTHCAGGCWTECKFCVEDYRSGTR
jgi:hypothetical protein